MINYFTIKTVKMKTRIKPTVSALVLSVFISMASAQNISDKEIKTNVIEITNAIEKLKQLEPVTYMYNSQSHKHLKLSTKKKYGFIAEDFQTVFPEMVHDKRVSYMAWKNHTKSNVIKEIDEASLIPVLVASIIELQQEVEKLKSELLSLKND